MTETPLQLRRGHRLEEELASHAVRLARRNQALEDFAGLIAHEVRSSLVAALRSREPRDGLTRSLELVDSILEAVRADQSDGETRSVVACARVAMDDLGLAQATLVMGPSLPFPVPPAVLRIVLRNLFENAAAAGATRIRVATVVGATDQTLVVDDDGCGPAPGGSYRAGAGLGLSLCRRLLSRWDAFLDLGPGPADGTRAAIVARRWLA